MLDSVDSQRNIDVSTPAVVLKFDANVFHHGGLGVIRGLGRRGVRVYGVYEDPLSPAAHSRYVRGGWLWRPDPDSTERVLEGMAELADRIGRPAVLLPTDDAAAIFLAEHGSTLRDRFRFAEPPRDLPRRVAGKYSMYRLCRQLGVPCPEAALVGAWDEVVGFAERVGFPVVCKLALPWRSTGSVRSTSLAHTWNQLAEIYRVCSNAAIGGLMLQEFIPGGREHDWFFHGYCDGVSRCRPAYTGVKERSYPAHAGLTSLGRSAENPALRRIAVDLLSRLAFRGIVDLDFRLDERDGQYKLLDFNPRLGAQFRLFRDGSGTDVALASYLDLTGQPIPDGAPVLDRRFLVENYDPIAALGYWRGGDLTPRAWSASLRDVHETAWFARDDPVPFALMCTWMVRRAVTRRFGRRRPETALPLYRAGRDRGVGTARQRFASPVEEDRV